MTAVWRIAVAVPAAAAAAFELALEPFADAALTTLDADPGAARRPGEPQPASWASDIWLADSCIVEGLATQPPDEGRLLAALAVAAAATGVRLPAPVVEPVAERDWVAETYRAFPEISVGRYRLRGSHITDPPQPGTVPITIDAAVAFGTGEHGTTRGCLGALDRLRRRLRPDRVLDIGCGSGILAIAAAKTWPCRVVASDIDPRAARVAAENTRLNGVAARVRTVTAPGYRSPFIAGQAPADLILSNILARPLARLAPDLARHLRPGGIAILSGLLWWQERMVLAAHAAQGLHLVFRVQHDDWTTLVLAG